MPVKYNVLERKILLIKQSFPSFMTPVLKLMDKSL